VPKGLPDVSQKFGADASDYSRAIESMLGQNTQLVNSIGDITKQLQQFEQASKVFTPFTQAARDAVASVALVRAELAQLTGGLQGVDQTLGSVAGKFAELKKAQEAAQSINSLSAAQDKLSQSSANAAATTAAMRSEVKGATQDVQDLTKVIEAAEQVINRQLGSTSMVQRTLGVGYGRAQDIMNVLQAQGIVGPSAGQGSGVARQVLIAPEGLEGAVQQLRALAPAATAATASLADLKTEYGSLGETITQMATAQALIGDTLSDVTVRAAKATETVAGLGEARAGVQGLASEVSGLGDASKSAGEGFTTLSEAAGTWAAAETRAWAAAETRANLVSALTARAAQGSTVAAARLAGLTGGGGGGGGGGSGGGGGGGGGGGVIPWYGGGGDRFDQIGAGVTAGLTYASVAGFVKQWYSAFHWAMMLTNEVLATVGPAVIAAGSAVAVGLQGAQDVYNRALAINAVGQSMGLAYGATPGSLAGMGEALQNAQNVAEGAVYSIAGAGIQAARSGAGGAFDQMGINTVDMLDRAAANLVLALQGGEGSNLAQIVSNGTNYLQQFGDVAANIGKTFLNVAPNLPGVGGDLLSTLQGATGGLAWLTGHVPGQVLGTVLAMEAAGRYGPVLVGGAGALVTKLGMGTQSLGATLTGRDTEAALAAKGGLTRSLTADEISGMGLTADEAAGIVVPTEAAAGLEGGGILGSLGGILETGGAAIGAVAAPEIALAGALAYGLWKGTTYQTPYQQAANKLQTQIGQQGFTQGFGSLISGLNAEAAVPGGGQSGWAKFGPLGGVGQGVANEFGGLFTGNIGRAFHGLEQEFGVAGMDPTKYQVAQSAMQNMAKTFTDMLAAGQPIQQLWSGLSHQSTSLASAFTIAQMAGLQLNSAFDKQGNLTKTAKQEIKDFQSAYGPMTDNLGAMGASIGAMTAMGGLQGTKISSVNSAWDQLTQLYSQGTSGTGALFSLLQAAPAKATAKALTSFTSPAGAAAWQAFASTSSSTPSLVSTTEGQLDWLRQAMTLGAVSSGQYGGMGAYYLKQLLPYGKQSQAALATVGGLAQELGMSGYDPTKNLAQNYKAISSEIDNAADSQKKFNSDMTGATIGLADVNRDAQQFVQTMQNDAASNAAAKAATDMTAFTNSIKGTNFSQTGLATFVGDLKQAGLSAQAIGPIIQQAMQKAGVSAATQKKIMLQVGADTNPAQHAIDSVTGKSVVIRALADAAEVNNLRTSIEEIQNKTVVITTNVVTHYETIGIPSITGLGSIRTVTPTGQIGSLGGHTGPGMQSGYRVPGYGGGDIVPAMLEPGETVVPKHLTPMVAPFLSGKVPGFADGGISVGEDVLIPDIQDAMNAIASQMISAVGTEIAGVSTYEAQAAARGAYQAAAGSGMMHPVLSGGVTAITLPSGSRGAGGGGGSGPLSGPHDLSTQMNQLLATLTSELAKSGFGKKVAVSIIDGLNAGMVDKLGSKGLANLAQTLVNKLITEVNYAKSTASSAMSGLNLGQMDTTTGSVGQQMQSYLQSVQNFTTELGQLSKEGLNKSIIQQLVAAGPVQGDLLAKSIMGGMKTTIAQNVVSGLNIGGMDVSAQTGSGSVQEQMQNYLQSEQSFAGDLGSLKKQHLNSQVMQQLIAAGPVQGDALAQSILSGAGGVGAVNQLYGQIGSEANVIGGAGASAYGPFGVGAVNQLWGKLGKSTNALGAAAAGAVYGGFLAPNLKSADITTNNVNVSVSIPGTGGGTLNLSASQIKQLVEEIQAKLLQQAKRNPKTGVALPYKGA
jgi:hypothetical protein